ncbi:hypothetical protein [Streptomyces sp. SM12]|uniref:hypothetical protein n=1 Tax=Streptomyces sp. SM12 TaxID=1071602 RepID=UPI0011B0AF1F|nr:hypothetical protein [Streptomyces sp. SM12]
MSIMSVLRAAQRYLRRPRRTAPVTRTVLPESDRHQEQGPAAAAPPPLPVPPEFRGAAPAADEQAAGAWLRARLDGGVR